MPRKQKDHSKIHESKEIYKARQFSLVAEKITRPNGVDTEIALTAQKLDHDEIIQVFQFSMPEIQDMIDQDKIVDALSILAIYRAMRYLN